MHVLHQIAVLAFVVERDGGRWITGVAVNTGQCGKEMHRLGGGIAYCGVYGEVCEWSSNGFSMGQMSLLHEWLYAVWLADI